MRRKGQFGFVEVFAWIALLILVVSGMIYLNWKENSLTIPNENAANYHFELINGMSTRTMISRYSYDYSDFCAEECEDYAMQRKLNAKELILLRFPKDKIIGSFSSYDIIKSEMAFQFEARLPGGQLSSRYPTVLPGIGEYLTEIGFTAHPKVQPHESMSRTRITQPSLLDERKSARDIVIVGSLDGKIRFIRIPQQEGEQ